MTTRKTLLAATALLAFAFSWLYLAPSRTVAAAATGTPYGISSTINRPIVGARLAVTLTAHATDDSQYDFMVVSERTGDVVYEDVASGFDAGPDCDPSSICDDWVAREVWNGKTSAGRRVPRGRYYLLFETPSGTTWQSVMVGRR